MSTVNLPMLHSLPVYPVFEQLQVYPSDPSFKQIPPKWHGLGLQASVKVIT